MKADPTHPPVDPQLPETPYRAAWQFTIRLAGLLSRAALDKSWLFVWAEDRDTLPNCYWCDAGQVREAMRKRGQLPLTDDDMGLTWAAGWHEVRAAIRIRLIELLPSGAQCCDFIEKHVGRDPRDEPVPESLDEARAHVQRIEDGLCLCQNKYVRRHLPGPTETAATGAEVPWQDDAPDYLPSSEAVLLPDCEMPLSRVSKLCRPDGPVRYMRKGKRCKVHIGDFRAYAKRHAEETGEPLKGVFKRYADTYREKERRAKKK